MHFVLYAEFLGRRPDADDVARALTMPGGGAHQVMPGQITDDGETTLCSARALAGSSEFSLDALAIAC